MRMTFVSCAATRWRRRSVRGIAAFCAPACPDLQATRRAPCPRVRFVAMCMNLRTRSASTASGAVALRCCWSKIFPYSRLHHDDVVSIGQLLLRGPPAFEGDRRQEECCGQGKGNGPERETGHDVEGELVLVAQPRYLVRGRMRRGEYAHGSSRPATKQRCGGDAACQHRRDRDEGAGRELRDAGDVTPLVPPSAIRTPPGSRRRRRTSRRCRPPCCLVRSCSPPRSQGYRPWDLSPNRWRMFRRPLHSGR